jgi:hypothetical protein
MICLFNKTEEEKLPSLVKGEVSVFQLVRTQELFVLSCDHEKTWPAGKIGLLRMAEWKARTHDDTTGPQHPDMQFSIHFNIRVMY